MNLMTILYIMIQEALADPLDMAPVYTKLRMSLSASLPDCRWLTTMQWI